MSQKNIQQFLETDGVFTKATKKHPCLQINS
jgi:hypothetical protein